MLSEKLDAWVMERTGLLKDDFGPESLHAYQLKASAEVLKRAALKSSFYKEYPNWNLGDFQSGHCNHWEDLPFVSQEDIRNRGMEFLCTSQSLIQRVTTLETSGTTGHPKRIYSTEADINQTIDYFRIGMSTFTKAGDKVLILLPDQRPGSIGKHLFTALEQLEAVPIAHGVVQNLQETFELILKSGPQIIVGIPSQVIALAKYGRHRGRNITSVQKVLLSTDRASRPGIEILEEIWKCHVYQYYGMTEAGFGWGLECEAHEGYHLYESDFYTEIVDPATGQGLPAGLEGEVVLTTLRREGMPLIRYKTGDLAKILESPCPCGSKLKRIGPIESRVHGRISLKSGGHFSRGELDDQLIGLDNLVDFEVGFQSGETRDCLFIDAYFWGELPKEALVLNEIYKISAMDQAVAQDELKIALSIRQALPEFCPAPKKRTVQWLNNIGD